MKIIRMVVGMLSTNCYLVIDEPSGEGYVIDPGSDSRTITGAAGKAGMKCLGILCTHGHMDHVGAVGKVAQALDAPVYITEADSRVLYGRSGGIMNRLGSFAVSRPEGVKYISGGDRFAAGNSQVEVRATPGHTPGSVSFLCGNALVCGDLVFQGSIGRTDLVGGSMQDLLKSVRREVFSLPRGTRILPGHGPGTTVGDEMDTNPFLSGLSVEGG